MDRVVFAEEVVGPAVELPEVAELELRALTFLLPLLRLIRDDVGRVETR